MGKRGPSPAPTRLKVVRGDQESRINRNEPLPSDRGDIHPPEFLCEDAEALDIWNYYARDLIDKGCLTAWDVDTFAVFCKAASVYRLAARKLGEQLTAQGAAGGVIKSPYHQIMRDCDQTMAKFSSRFGLTPGDRADLKVGEDNKPTNGAERILG
jgi:P27 family predicted phage terminase small subunit